VASDEREKKMNTEDLDYSSKNEANQALAQIEQLQKMTNGLRQKLATRH